MSCDTGLKWTPGEFAGTHDVYFGKTFADVNAASRDDPRGVQVSQGQTDAQYDPDGLLEYGQTYYWRIDEVNKTPDNTIFKGNVWSFTVEPYSYPLAGVKATASSSQPNMGPEKTVDGSGLTGDLHGTEASTMWMSTGTKPNWIQYEFDAVYKLDKLLVWNSNQIVECVHRLRSQGRHDRVLRGWRHVDDAGRCAAVRPGHRFDGVRGQQHRQFRRRHGEICQADDRQELCRRRDTDRPGGDAVLLRPGPGPRRSRPMAPRASVSRAT